MKNFQQNLLITLALALCGLCAWQWYAQTRQRLHIDSLDQAIFKQSTEIQGYTNSIKTMDTEIAGLQARINELKLDALTNSQIILSQKRDLLRLQVNAGILSNEIVQYQSVTNFLDTKLQEAYDSVIAANAIAEKYNEMVERVKKLQDAAAAAAAGSKR